MDLIKKNWKWVPFLLLIVLGYLLFTQYQLNIELKRDKERLLENISLDKQEIEISKNREKELTYKVESYRFRANELERANVEQYKLLQKYSKNIDKIESYMKIVSETQGAIQTPLKDSIVYIPNLDGVAVIDTTSIKSFKYSDSYLDLSGFISKDTLYSRYNYVSRLEGVLKWERQGLLKSDKLVFEIHPENPNERIVGLESIVIEKPEKKFWEKTSFKIGTGVVIGAGLTAGLFYLAK